MAEVLPVLPMHNEWTSAMIPRWRWLREVVEKVIYYCHLVLSQETFDISHVDIFSVFNTVIKIKDENNKFLLDFTLI